MDQKELRQWESRCVQEEAPRCTAACPLHVDVRTFCTLMERGLFDKAWQVLARTLPLPGVLARLCDGPCRSACVREQAGGSVAVDLLERFCAGCAKPVAPPRPLPSRHKNVAVLGGGLTGLCAAWEMARKGFSVSLFCDVAGKSLLGLPEDVLPRKALARELESLSRLGVVVHQGEDLSRDVLKARIAEHHAVFVDYDGAPDLAHLGAPDAVTLAVDEPGVFAFGPRETSPVLRAAAGRRAANSVDRFVQGVSLVSQRGQEGSCPTRLFTSLDKAGPVPPAHSGSLRDADQAREEAGRCLRCECMECVKSCKFLAHYKQYPKVYVRRIYNNESIVMGTRQANRMINSCTLCGLCEVVCPEDFSMAEVCLEARRHMVESGTMPPSAHEFALRDMAFADGGKCALSRPAPGTEVCDTLFFPGCQLTASNPGAVEAAHADLLARLGPVGLMLRCCAAPALWAGRRDLHQAAVESLSQSWKDLGQPRIVAACPTCLTHLRQALPEAEVVSYWSVLRSLGLPESAKIACQTLTVADPCAARHDESLRGDVRGILHELGIETVEAEFNGELAQCCGYGGLSAQADPELGRATARRRAGVAEGDVATYCAMCRDMMAGSGIRTLHVLDLLFPGEDDPAGRTSPGYSDRRENRARLRERLLRTLWKETDGPGIEPFESVRVVFTDQAAEVMEARRILKSDVQKVLLRAGRSGKHLVHGETGRRLAAYCPAAITYWVEYALENGGHTVYNVWSHRMRVGGGWS